jgi:hypothetical protein
MFLTFPISQFLVDNSSTQELYLYYNLDLINFDLVKVLSYWAKKLCKIA